MITESKTLRIHRALNGAYSTPLTYNTPAIQTDVEQKSALRLLDLGVKTRRSGQHVCRKPSTLRRRRILRAARQ